MIKHSNLPVSFAIFLLAVFGLVQFAAAADPIRFKIDIDPSMASGGPVSGRLLVFMRRDDGKPTDGFGTDFADPNAVWVSGTEVTDLEPGKPVEVYPDEDSYPSAFSTAPAGSYQLFALLDRDHSYTYNGPGSGDLYSKVAVTSMPAAETTLTLYKAIPEHQPQVHANARIVEFESPMLSRFWGRPIKMQATVVLPPSYGGSNQKYPTVYSIHGYGGTHLGNLPGVESFLKSMTDGTRPEMIYVYLNAHNSMGHHVFADSVNNGPWGSALVQEFIPYLEKQFRMDAKPSGRFLTGHSSGGWSTLWVMITHPDFFGGTWSTSPDPTDFRNFTGPDLTNPAQNAYVDASGKEYNLVRDHAKQIMSVRQYAQQETVTGYYGGQFASFNAVFSPKGPDGRPMPLFDVKTGKIDPFVAKAWEKYDISRVLRDNWATLGPKLKGKLHLYVGTADTFHLDESLRLLDAELRKLGSDAKIEYIPEKTHFDLYKDGLGNRIAWEMYKIARPKAKAAAK
jgi:enterochelin esterase-like enzyme